MKKMKLIIGILSIASVGHTQGPPVIYDGMKGIETTGFVQVFIESSDKDEVRIEGSDADKEQITTEIKDGILQISSKGKLSDPEKTKVYVLAKDIQHIRAEGSSKVMSSGIIATETLNVEGSGIAEIELEVKATKLIIDLSGAGDAILRGGADELKADISGAGNLKAYKLVVNKANVKVSGAGDAKVYALEELNADVSGAGSVIYMGNPETNNIDISGAGSVRQTKGEGSVGMDTTKFKIKDKELIIVDKYEKGDKEGKQHKKKSQDFNNWAGIDLGVNLLDEGEYAFKVGNNLPTPDYVKSLVIDINLFEKDIHLVQNYANIVTGVGFGFYNYSFRDNYTLNYTTGYTGFVQDTSVNYIKNKLKTSFVNVPLLLEFNTGKDPDKSFHLGVGAIFGFMMNSKLKQKYKVDDSERKVKIKEDFNLSPFRASATVRVGYGDLNLFATYALKPFFEKGKGPLVNPFTVGISLISF